MITAAENPDKSIALIIFNPTDKSENIHVKLDEKNIDFKIQGKAIQTLIIPSQTKIS